jgi:hypothetical protein
VLREGSSIDEIIGIRSFLHVIALCTLLGWESLKMGPKQVVGGLNLKRDTEVRAEDNRELRKSVLPRTNRPPHTEFNNDYYSDYFEITTCWNSTRPN